MKAMMLFRASLCSAALLSCALVAGCGGGGGSSLPGSLTVPLPGNQSIDAALGTGPQNLANTSWEIHDAAAPNTAPIARVDFGSDGQIEQLALTGDVSANIAGASTTLVVDQGSHVLFPGVTYVAGSYGGQNGSDVGVSVYGVVFAGPTEIATLTLSIFGTRSGDTINGTFSVSTTIEPAAANILPGAPIGTQSSDQAVLLKKA